MPAEGILSLIDERIGEVFLDADELAVRVTQLGAELAAEYEGRDPILIGSLKACVPFICDLSRALPIRDANGQIIRWFGTNTDVTERLAADRALNGRAQGLSHLLGFSRIRAGPAAGWLP